MDNLSEILIPKLFVFSKFLNYKSIVGPKIFFGEEFLTPDFIMYNDKVAFVWEWSRHKLDGRKKKQLQKYHRLASKKEFFGEVNFKGEHIKVIFLVLEKYYKEYLNFIKHNNLNTNLSYIKFDERNQHKLVLPKSLEELNTVNSLQVPTEYFCKIDVDNFSFLKMEKQLRNFISNNIFDVEEIISKLVSKELFSIFSPSLRSKLKKSILKHISTILM
jgi:hypothetical protein